MSDENLRLAAYCRVSREKPKKKNEKEKEPETTIENQIQQIKEYAQQKGLIIEEWFKDEVVSGDAEYRPAFEEMFTRIHEFDGMIVRDVDRFGRETVDVLLAEKQLRKLGKRFIILDLDGMNIDTSTPIGNFMFTMAAAIAKLEKGKILERMRVGYERYVAEGGKVGRKMYKIPRGFTREDLEMWLKAEMPLASIARLFKRHTKKDWDYRTVKALIEREGLGKYLAQYKKKSEQLLGV